MDGIEDIDRQLDALGSVARPLEAAELSLAIERVLGSDRSLAKLDELLVGLGAPIQRMPSAPLPRRSGLPPRFVTPAASLASPVPVVASPSAWPPRATPLPPPEPLPVLAPLPPLAPLPSLMPALDLGPVFTARQSSPPPRIMDTLEDTPLSPLPPITTGDSDLDAETAALLGDVDVRPSMPSAVPLPFGPSVETSLSALEEVPTRVGPPPEEIEAEAAAADAAADEQQARERRDNVRALLDQEIDPNDFPSERPPRRSNRPPAPAPLAADDAAPDEQAPNDEDGVEMLLDDDEILEIEDDELLEEDES